MKSVYTSDELLPLSGIQHFVFCRRQWALKILFRNDASSARPEGSMEVHKVYWWEHNSPNGQYSSAKVHRLLEVSPKNDEPKSIGDCEITLRELPGLKCEVIDGE